MGKVELETFLGEWRDSIGNDVEVDWAGPGSRGGQLDVLLTKPRSRRDPIRLNVKHKGSGHFECGHYELDIHESSPDKIVWVDCWNRGKSSVWERKTETARRSTGESESKQSSRGTSGGENRNGKEGNWLFNKWEESARGTQNASWDSWSRDTWSKTRLAKNVDSCGRDRSSATEVNDSSRSWDSGRSNECRVDHKAADPTSQSFLADYRNCMSPCTKALSSVAPYPYPSAPAPWVPPGGTPGAWVPPPHGPALLVPSTQAISSVDATAAIPIGSEAGPLPLEMTPSTVSLGSPPSVSLTVSPVAPLAAPPAAPSATPVPGAGTVSAADPAVPLSALAGLPSHAGNDAAPHTNWRPLIEAMYRRFNPDKLHNIDVLLAKYSGHEAQMYQALVNKYLPNSRPEDVAITVLATDPGKVNYPTIEHKPHPLDPRLLLVDASCRQRVDHNGTTALHPMAFQQHISGEFAIKYPPPREDRVIFTSMLDTEETEDVEGDNDGVEDDDIVNKKRRKV